MNKALLADGMSGQAAQTAAHDPEEASVTSARKPR